MNRNVLLILALTALVCLAITSVADAKICGHKHRSCKKHCKIWGRRFCCRHRIVRHCNNAHCRRKRSDDAEPDADEDQEPCPSFEDCLKPGEEPAAACLSVERVSEGEAIPMSDHDLRISFVEADEDGNDCLDQGEFPNLCSDE